MATLRSSRRTADRGGGAVLSRTVTRSRQVAAAKKKSKHEDDEEYLSVSESDTEDDDDDEDMSSDDDDDDDDLEDVRMPTRTKKQSAAATQAQIERAVARATERAVDKAVQRVAGEAAKKAAAESARRVLAKVAGKTRKREVEEVPEVVEISAPTGKRQRGVTDVDPQQSQMRVVRRALEQKEPYRLTGPGTEGWSPIQHVQQPQPQLTRRIVRAGPRVVHEQGGFGGFSGGGGYSGSFQSGPAQFQRRPRGPAGGEGPVIQHRQITQRQVQGMQNRLITAPYIDPAKAAAMSREAGEKRQVLERQLRQAIQQRAGMDPERMTQEIIQLAGGEGGLVVGAPYNMTPQGADCIRQLVRAYCCRAAAPVPCVPVLLHQEGRYGATVWVDGQARTDDLGNRIDGSYEDPLLRAIRNAVALAEVKRPKKQAPPKKKEVFTVDDEDDIDDIMED